MSIPNNESMTQYAPFLLPALTQDVFSQEELEDDLDGLNLGFPRIKIPGGGVPQFEMPGGNPENPTYETKLECIILFSHNTNAYWEDSESEDDSTPPDCQSVDGKVGLGTPGGMCYDCEMNRFGSDPSGRGGKACKNMRMLYIQQSGDYMPKQLALPPTSIRPFSDFYSASFLSRKRAIFGSLVEITLKRTSSNGFDYSVACFKVIRDFEGEELAKVQAYARGFREQIKQTMAKRIADKASETAAAVETVTAPMHLPENSDRFVVGSAINAEREALPM